MNDRMSIYEELDRLKKEALSRSVRIEELLDELEQVAKRLDDPAMAAQIREQIDEGRALQERTKELFDRSRP